MKTNLLLNAFTPNESSISVRTPYKFTTFINSPLLLTLLIAMAFSHESVAQNVWNGGGTNNWTTTGNWSLGHIPTNLEDVIIKNSKNININTAAECKSLIIEDGNKSNTLTINSGQSLTVDGNVHIGAGTGTTDDKLITILGTGSLTAGSLSMADPGSDLWDSKLAVATGTVNISGNITMNGSAIRNSFAITGAGTLNLGGDFLGTNGGVLTCATNSTVKLYGSNPQLISGANTTSFYHLTINKSAAANIVTGTTRAFTVAGNLTVTQGNLILQATNANYSVAGDVTVAADGTLTHAVDWATGYLLSVGGSFIVNGGGLFDYGAARSHVQMTSTGVENISTGSNPASAFAILTLKNGTFNAAGTVRINDNFWSMFGTGGSFHTLTQTVYANAALLCNGGTTYIDGGTLNVTGGLYIGYGVNSTVALSSGTLNADFVTVASGSNGNFNHSGGTSNIIGDLTINNAGTYTCTGSPAINIGGNWVNNKNAGGFVPATGTVTFNNPFISQSITGTATTQTFNNIVVDKTGQQLNASGSTTALTANGAVTITNGTFAAGTAANINVAGNWTNNGTAFTPGAGRVTFNGGSPQVLSGSTVSSFYNVTLNNSSGLSLSGVDVDITGAASALIFTNGKITTGPNHVILNSAGTIAGATTGKYIYGNLKLGVPTGTPTRVFEIGDGIAYTPISVVFNNVTVAGDITAYTVGADHPNITASTIDETQDVNRYWVMANTGVSLTSYFATFNFLASDIDAGANTANFIIARRASSWANPTTTAKNPTSTTATLSSFGAYACGEGGAAVPTMVTQPLDRSACSAGSISIIASANTKPYATSVNWQISTNNGATFTTLIIASPYTVSTNTVSGITTSTLTISPTTALMDATSYRAVFTNSRGSVTSFDGSLNITAGPSANAGAALAAICGTAASAPLGGSVGGSATGGTWSTSSGGTFSPSATNLNATWTPPVGFTGTATLILTTSGGACGTTTDSKTQVVSSAAATVTISPSTATICVNGIQALTASNSEISTTTSGTVNVAIPDNSASGATNTIAVSGIPAGATVTGISVTLNVTHTRDQELIMNLRAPNGNILNLVNAKGGTGANFTNTTINSTSLTALSSGTVPFTGTFKPDATNGIGATGQVSNVITFSSLYSTPNGNWVFSARDGAATRTGTINSWSVVITYMDPVTWSPATYLYTNATATIPYSLGTFATTVYSKPSIVSTTTYTATATNSVGCMASNTTTVTAGPIVTITPDYCYGGGYIKLQASSTPAATSWLWNTGATTSFILVNLAGNYTATATTSGGCSASTNAQIAQELVTNGAFNSGNTGFTSSYGFVNYTSGSMYPEGIYTVGNDPYFTHTYFFGKDHTTGSGNMLIVNGSSSPVYVWQQILNVQPNTTYYFSAWAMSLNDAGPFAQLQFNINGSLIGTTAVLPAGPNTTTAPYSWTQFYGSWTSGAGITTATVSIRDLQTATGGNDFGLDDISFGTLSTFISLTSGSGSDTQRVCKNTPINTITYSVGAGATGPSVTGLPPGVGYSFNGTTLTISGTPTSIGTYNFTVTNSTCNPITKYGQIKVQEDTLTLASAVGTDAQSTCLNAAITNITYSVGASASGATVTGLPPGVNFLYSTGTVTISGTPTTATNYTYTVTTTGSCSPVSVTGIIYVRRQIISRSSAPGTNTQVLCTNSAITNITYNVSGVATGAGVIGLPTGVTGSYSAGVFTIRGTPTAAPGIYPYVVTTTGPCSSVTANGTITVDGGTVTQTSPAGTNAQTLCNSTAIADITYDIAGTGTGVSSVTGLPSGVSWAFNAGTGVLLISGTPGVSGTFNYTITTSGGSCAAVSATGTITVTALNTIAAGINRTTCINTAITSITLATTGATGATFSGLPAGVNGTWAANVVTISGTPTASGTFTYTVTTTGGCPPATATGTITVTALNTIAAGINRTTCINTAITSITLATTGATGATFSGLPAGVTGTWAANVATITGTPTASGTFTYTVTTTGGCPPATATGTITVTALNTIAAGINRTTCINTAITSITLATTGATGATFSGLPAGVTGTWAANVVTLSGTPTASGTFNYTVTTTGGCPPATATGTITVTALNTIAAGINQTTCINTAITSITLATTGATGATFSGLPAGVTGTWAANVVTISGTPTASGTFNYTVTTTGGCPPATATGTITVTALNTIAAGTNQTTCINTAITSITLATTGATGATFSGLPAGVTGTWAANVATITGTPTASGTFTYTVTTTGGCPPATATGTITVTALNTIAAGINRTTCINTAITSITLATTGATGATFSGLPAGVTGTWAANVVTLSGTPTASGTFNYTVTTTGGCPPATATGTITVTALNTIAAGINQTTCINTAITSITLATTGATGATFSGLPAGVTGTWAANVVTISGTPTASGTFNYTVTTTGGCPPATATGTITVTALNTIAAGTNQTTCINTAITSITLATTGATGATFSGLPAGVTGTWAANVVTISGTPTASGTFNYTVTTTGGCPPATATGTITVTALNTIAAGTNQTTCINTAITSITLATTGATGATFSGLPAGVTGTWAANVVTLSGTPTASGTFNYTVTTTGGCPPATATGTITITALNTIAAGINRTTCINTAITSITLATTGASGATFSGLPAGVTGTWAANVVTISGTPTASGTFNYTVTTTGGCPPATATGTITVTALNTIAAGINQTTCINTAITSITLATTGATGATFSGLPAGVTGSWAANVVTISGTPTASGTFTYTVTTTGGCPPATATGTITVTALNTIAAGINRTTCINTAITSITLATTGATGATFSGLPAGVNGTWAANVVTISGTPTASGTFTYTVTTTGGCPPATATGTITVTALNTIAAGINRTTCINTAITSITLATTGATGATFSGLPAGVTGTWAANVVTISGTPTASGTFTYTVTTTGGCPPATATGTITVTALNTIAAGTNQTTCINTAITSITLATTGATGATFSGLPAGVTGTWAANVVTISGTPTASGTFTYTVTTTGGCPPATAIGTITVTALNTIAAGTNRTTCINTAITSITLATTGATGATFSGLPAGVNGTWAANVVTITGTPTASGTFTYTVTTTGGCPPATATGTITVTALNTIAAGINRTTCINTAITSITLATTGATGATFSGLPAGVTGTWAANVVTITGTPTASGTFNYTVTTTGGCPPATATGTITVAALNTIAAGINRTTCINTAITSVTLATTGATGATFSGLPAGVTGTWAANVVTISGTPTASGTFTYTVTATGTCAAVVATGSITVSPAAVGGSIADVNICYADNGNLLLTGNVGTVTRWETSDDNSTWTNISNTTTTQAFTGLTRTTWYRALVQSGVCASSVYSNTAKVGIHNLWTGETSSDWNTGSNWSDGLTPTTSCPDVTIPLLTIPNVYPQLTSGVATVNNIIIYPGATMVVSNATLQVAGTISNSGSLNITAGTLELNGASAAQTIAGSVFDTHTIHNLIISNSNDVSFANANDTVKITGTLSFGTNNAVLNTNNNLTLISNAAGTASVGDLTNGGINTGNNIMGNATVERYIPYHPKAWQFLSVPTSGQTIKNAWQEANTSLANTRPGYGTIITGEMAGAVALGFDIYTPAGPSMKFYNSGANSWVGVGSVTSQIFNQKGYMFFVRGDRSVTAYNQPATATTLRTTGKLFTIGADAPAATIVPAGKIESIGNPYASAVDFRLISRPSETDLDDAFYVWDPLLTNNYNGLGGYQTISAANGWKPIPGGTANYDANIAYPYIQSGQAFLVHATGAGGTVSFAEANKVSQYAMANRIAERVSDRQFMRMSLTTSGMFSDGNVVAFDNDFSNIYDASDALKIINAGENTGIKKDNKVLALEARRPVVVEDTVFYHFTNMSKPNYKMKFSPENMAAGLTAYLVDKFTNTTAVISTTDTTSYNFGITSAAGSYAADRFYMIFRQALPMAITSITGNRNSSGSLVSVKWTTEREAAVTQYEIQRSSNGSDFESISDATPAGNNAGTYNYTAVDPSPLAGINYYRIKAARNTAGEVYSAIVRVVPVKNQSTGKNAGESITVANSFAGNVEVAMVNIYPNPVVGKTMNIQFVNYAKGSYNLAITNRLGELIHSKTIQINSISTLETIHFDKSVAAGNYQVIITGPEHTKTIKQVVIE